MQFSLLGSKQCRHNQSQHPKMKSLVTDSIFTVLVWHHAPGGTWEKKFLPKWIIPLIWLTIISAWFDFRVSQSCAVKFPLNDSEVCFLLQTTPQCDRTCRNNDCLKAWFCTTDGILHLSSLTWLIHPQLRAMLRTGNNGEVCFLPLFIPVLGSPRFSSLYVLSFFHFLTSLLLLSFIC